MDSLIHPKEKQYFMLSLVISIIIYLVFIVGTLGIGLIYIVFFAVFYIMGQGLFLGSIRGNAIRVSEKQFPEVDRMAKELSEKMGLFPVPSVYILQSGGVLNAFATKFLGRNFVVIFSDVLELAYTKGEAAVAFVVAHELAHIKRDHLTYNWLLIPSKLIPLLGSAYSRACEYTCDRFGSYYRPDGALDGLLVLAAGKKLYQNVNKEEFMKQAGYEGGFFLWLAEHTSSHPNLPKRLAAAFYTEEVKNYLANKS
jgi:Zn-dependent protease with chaperone function